MPASLVRNVGLHEEETDLNDTIIVVKHWMSDIESP